MLEALGVCSIIIAPFLVAITLGGFILEVAIPAIAKWIRKSGRK